MTKPFKKEIDAITGQEIIIELTAEEIAELIYQEELEAKKKTEEDAQIKANATVKAALLTRLGITEDEAKLLLS